MGGYPGWQDVQGLDDVALIVDVSDNSTTVRWWVEQVGPTTSAGRPIVAAVSAAAAPGVRPYYQQGDTDRGQLCGLISGIPAAAAYEADAGWPGRATRSLAAQSVAHLGLVTVGLAGTFMGFRAQATRKSDRRS